MEDIEKVHSTSKMLWLIIDNLVYNITKYVPWHPGGQAILKSFKNKDATDAFNYQHHSRAAVRCRDQFLVGRFVLEKTIREEIDIDLSDENEEE